MNTTARKLRRVLRYISHFGLRAGWQAARLHGRRGAMVSVCLPNLDRPLWARTGSSDVETFEEVFVDRQYEVPFTDFSPRHILDLGANVGYASIYFAARWPEARILAVEPSTQNFALMRKNTASWPQITCLQAAVWGHHARVCIGNPDDEPNAYRMSEASTRVEESVPAMTVPELAQLQECERLDLVKMDVEGAESEIFRAAAGWLDRVDGLVIELHDRIVPGCAEALYAALHGRRFQQEIVGSNLAIDLRSSR